MWCQDTLHQGNNVGAVEDVELGGILGEDLGESKLLHCASSIIWRVERDVGWRRGWGVGWRRLDGEEALSCCCPSLRWSKAQVDLEKIVGFLGLEGPCGRVVHGSRKLSGRETSRESRMEDGRAKCWQRSMKIEEAGMLDRQMRSQTQEWVDVSGYRWLGEIVQDVRDKVQTKHVASARWNKSDCL